MVSDLVEATPKLSADCFLAMKLRPPDEALGRVGGKVCSPGMG